MQANESRAAAETLFQRALATVEKTLGPDHPKVARFVSHVGELQQETAPAGAR